MKINKKIFGILLIVLVIAVGALYGYNCYQNGVLQLTRYVIADEKIPESFDGYTMLVIADIHNAPFARDFEELFRENKPDVVLFAGDMVSLPSDNLQNVKKVAKVFDGIPMYAVSGNHESQNYGAATILEELSHVGVVSLDDAVVKLERDGEYIVLAGLSDPKNDYVMAHQYENAKEMTAHLFENEEDAFKILVNHRSDMYPALKSAGADLIVSGHLHGGLVKLPLLGRMIGKNGELFPEYAYGLYEGETGEADMIVSGGCDLNRRRMRIFNPPEAVMVTLSPSSLRKSIQIR